MILTDLTRLPGCPSITNAPATSGPLSTAILPRRLGSVVPIQIPHEQEARDLSNPCCTVDRLQWIARQLLFTDDDEGKYYLAVDKIMLNTADSTPSPAFFVWLNRVIQFGNACASVLWPTLCLGCQLPSAVILGIYLVIAVIWATDVFKLLFFIHKARKGAAATPRCHLALEIAGIICLVLEMLWILVMPSLRSWTFVVLILMFTLMVKTAAHFHRLTVARMFCQNSLDRGATWYRPHTFVRAALPMVLLVIVLPNVCLMEFFEDPTPILAGTLLSRHADCLSALDVPPLVVSRSESEPETESEEERKSESEHICSQVLEDVMTFFGSPLYSLKVGDREFMDNTDSAPWSHQNYRQIFVNDVTIIFDYKLQTFPMWMSLLVCQIFVVLCTCLLLLWVERLLRATTFPVTETQTTSSLAIVSRPPSEHVERAEERAVPGPSSSATVPKDDDCLADDAVRSSVRSDAAEPQRNQIISLQKVDDLMQATRNMIQKKRNRRCFFFNAMSHEFRTPVAIMVSNAELLKSTTTSPGQL